MIDASKQFSKEKKKNLMTPENIAHILKLYLDRTDVKKEAHLASYEEIKKNDFNLNIPRYVDTFEPEPEISLSELADDMKKTGAEIAKSKESLLSMMKELDADSPEEQAALSDFFESDGGYVTWQTYPKSGFRVLLALGNSVSSRI